ncbi:MAG: carbohydrate ABC transporter permease [Hungatella hathewayi]
MFRLVCASYLQPVLVWKMIFCGRGAEPVPVGDKRPGELDWGEHVLCAGVTYLWKNAGYDMLLWLAGMSAIPESLYEAARVDGAGGFDNLRYITIPMLRGTFGLVLILSVVNSFRVYREAYLLAGSYPSDTIYLIPHLFSNWFLKLDVQKMSTAAVMMTAVSVILALAVNWGRNRVGKGIGRRRRRRVGRRAG